MTYGFEAVIPLEIGFPTLRTSLFSLDNNDQLLEKSLDLINERREMAMVQLQHYQQKLKQGYYVGVKVRPLASGDLVLKRVVAAAKNPSQGKLGPNWEGLYCINSMVGIRAYFLEDLDENVVPCPWNVNNFRMYLLMKGNLAVFYLNYYCLRFFLLFQVLNKTSVMSGSSNHILQVN